MNYIGSKFSLLGEIQALLARHGVVGGSFCDLFSGTTVVAQMARQAGFQVIANDLQSYSYTMQQAFLETEGYPGFETLRRALPAIDQADAAVARTLFGLGPAPGLESAPLRRVLAYLESLEPVAGPFYEAYCEGGEAERNYFSRENGMRCEAIRDQLEAWKVEGWLSGPEFALLLASLIETMDHLANTASVYGAYLKHVKKSAQAPLVLRVPRLSTLGHGHRANRQDANALVAALAAEGPHDVLYLDPPYNQRQYHANYHILETLALWDLGEFEPQGKTGLRPGGEQRSRYCSRKQVAAAFGDLIARADFKHILVSYNNEGLLSEDALKAMLEAKGECDFYKVPYRRFRADADSETRRYKGDETHEFLFYVQVKAPTPPLPAASSASRPSL